MIILAGKLKQTLSQRQDQLQSNFIKNQTNKENVAPVRAFKVMNSLYKSRNQVKMFILIRGCLVDAIIIFQTASIQLQKIKMSFEYPYSAFPGYFPIQMIPQPDYPYSSSQTPQFYTLYFPAPFQMIHSLPSQQVFTHTSLQSASLAKQVIPSNTHANNNTPEEQSFLQKKNNRQRKPKKRYVASAVPQKQNRNVFSNILRNFFRKIGDIIRLESLVRKIIKNQGLKITFTEFSEYLRKLRMDHTRYIRVRTVKQLFQNQNKKQCSLIMRILLKHYLNSDCLIMILTSKKINEWSVKHHLEGIKLIKLKLFF